MQHPVEKPVILFDGICVLCNSSVHFILKNEQKQQLLFASLQSDAAEKVLLQYNMKKNTPDSILFVEDGKVYDKSAAVLRICRYLKWPWRLVLVFRLVPNRLLDGIYDFVAKNRYNWFGKKESCTLVIPANKNRFI